MAWPSVTARGRARPSATTGQLHKPTALSQSLESPFHTQRSNTTPPAAATMGGGRVIEIPTKEEWDKQLAAAAAAGQAVLVDFSATWCGPCQMISPFFAQLSEQFPSLVFVKIDVDANSAVAGSCGVRAMPTFQVWKDGKMAEELVGADKNKLKALVEKYAS